MSLGWPTKTVRTSALSRLQEAANGGGAGGENKTKKQKRALLDSPESDRRRWCWVEEDRNREGRGARRQDKKGDRRGQERTGSSSHSCRGSSHAESSRVFFSPSLSVNWQGPMTEENKINRAYDLSSSCLCICMCVSVCVCVVVRGWWT